MVKKIYEIQYKEGQLGPGAYWKELLREAKGGATVDKGLSECRHAGYPEEGGSRLRQKKNKTQQETR